MTLLWADGFEDGTAGAWTLTGWAVGAGRFGNGITNAASGTYFARTGLGSTAGPYILGFAFKPTAAATDIFEILGANDVDSHILVRRGAAGEVTFRGAAATLGTSAINVLPASAWSYIEVKFSIHDTTGIAVVRVNGVEVINVVGDTRDSAATAQVLNFGYSTVSMPAGCVFDDVYLCDTLGTTNNDFLGEVTVEHLRPVADDTAQWMGSDLNSTNNYDLVDEAGTFNAADYVASSTVGQRDLYTTTASTRPITSPVAGVLAVAVAQKTDAGARTVKLNIKEGAGGTVRQSADLGLPTTFGEIRAAFDRKGDGSAWTVADVNALRIGMEVAT